MTPPALWVTLGGIQTKRTGNPKSLTNYTAIDVLSSRGGASSWGRPGASGEPLWVAFHKASTPAPTPAPTMSLSSATGDPHLQNMFGQRFDLVRPGKAVLVSVPRGTPVEDAMLVVEADARRLGTHCSDMYFQEINATGTWANKVRPGGFHFDAHDARDETPKWLKLGLVELKVGSGHTDKGQPYLNVYVKNLQRTGYRVGGLLGEDDHTEAAAPEKGCQKMLSLEARLYGQASDLKGSVAIGY
ncbi:unnamed protein product [Prorocentrum cordatum]|uniref:Uncharacterized protein n=1 Tax=Prorocentrum cordatum TaxID=2364126 RepID=A0ABN9RPA1_9DINO|nr:unnamed protein product [Polarella glacialis]